MTKRPCNCGRAAVGPFDRKTMCALCWYALNSEEFQRLWDIPPSEEARPTEKAPRNSPAKVRNCCDQENEEFKIV